MTSHSARITTEAAATRPATDPAAHLFLVSTFSAEQKLDLGQKGEGLGN